MTCGFSKISLHRLINHFSPNELLICVPILILTFSYLNMDFKLAFDTYGIGFVFTGKIFVIYSFMTLILICIHTHTHILIIIFIIIIIGI